MARQWGHAGKGALATAKEGGVIMTTSNKRSDVIAADQAMITGINKFLTQIASLPVGGQSMTPADIVKVFQERLDTGHAVQTAEAARVAAIKADRDLRVKTTATVQSVRRIVLGMFSQAPDTLAVFGLKAPKVVKKKVDVKAAAVAKSNATRKARNTLGKKAKLAVKGATPVGKTEPVQAPATPAVPATPATPATPAKPNA
jgi:hypothetical protein